MPTTKTPVLEVRNLEKTYGTGEAAAKALRGVNMQVYFKDYVIVFGHSGSGKSTLLHVLAGLEKPSKGKVLIRGEDLTRYSVDDLAVHRRKKVGLVFQQFNLIRSMSVVDNVALTETLDGADRETRLKRARQLLSEVGLAEHADKLPQELSGGQQQKVAIARALMINPWILLVDEPTGNLDSKSAEEIMEILKKLNRKSNRTIVLVTHNPDYLHYATKLVNMKDGKVVETRTKRGRVVEEEVVEELAPSVEDTLLKHKEVPVEALGLSPKTLTILKRAHIKTVGQLIKKLETAAGLKGLKGIGKKTAQRIRTKLDDLARREKEGKVDYKKLKTKS